MKLTSGKNSTPLLLSVMILALLFALYYYLVKPKIEEVESLESSVNTLDGEIVTLQKEIDTIKNDRANQTDNGFAIRKKLPDNREVGSLLRNFEEIEFITGSRITNISFNGYDSLVSSSGIKDPSTATGEVADSTQQNDLQELIKQNQQNQELVNKVAPTNEAYDAETGNAILNGEAEGEAAPVTTIAAETLPPNLKLLTYSLDLEAQTAEKLVLFIKEVERLERVMHVDAISYSLPGEEDAFATEEEKASLTVTLQVTTFYYE